MDKKNINIGDIVNNWDTQYEEGLTQDESLDILNHVIKLSKGDFDIKKYNNAMMCLTCPVVDNKTLYYKNDIVAGLESGLGRGFFMD